MNRTTSNIFISICLIFFLVGTILLAKFIPVCDRGDTPGPQIESFIKGFESPEPQIDCGFGGMNNFLIAFLPLEGILFATISLILLIYNNIKPKNYRSNEKILYFGISLLIIIILMMLGIFYI